MATACAHDDATALCINSRNRAGRPYLRAVHVMQPGNSDSINSAAAAALAGPGFDHLQVEVVRPGAEEGRTLFLSVKSEYGKFEATSEPRVIPKKIHTVSASIIAALRREDKVIWVG